MNVANLKEFLKGIPDDIEIMMQMGGTKDIAGCKRVMYGSFKDDGEYIIFAPYGTHLFEGDNGYKEKYCLQHNGRIDGRET